MTGRDLFSQDEIDKVIGDIGPYWQGDPFMNKPCVANQVCHEDKVKVLDKIRAEIEEQKKERCFDDDDMFIYQMGLNDALYIIDKYKAESEEQA